MKKKLLIIALSVFILCLSGCSIEDSDSDSLGDNTELLQTTTTPIVTTATTTPSATKDDTQTDISDTQPEILPSDEFSFEKCEFPVSPERMSLIFYDMDNEGVKYDRGTDIEYTALTQMLSQSRILTDKSDFIISGGNTYYASIDMSITSIEAARHWFYTLCDQSVEFDNLMNTPGGQAAVFIEENGKLYVIEGYLTEDVELTASHAYVSNTADTETINACFLVRGNAVDREKYSGFCRFCYSNNIGFYDIEAIEHKEITLKRQDAFTIKFAENIFEILNSFTTYEDTVDYSIPAKYSDIEFKTYESGSYDRIWLKKIDATEEYEILSDNDLVAQIQRLVDKGMNFTFRTDNFFSYKNYNNDIFYTVADFGITSQEDINERFYQIYHPDSEIKPPVLSIVDNKPVYSYWNMSLNPLEDIRVYSAEPKDDGTLIVKAKAIYRVESLCSEEAILYRQKFSMNGPEYISEDITLTAAKNQSGQWRILTSDIKLMQGSVLHLNLQAE